ncbi:MAG: glutamate 5-kinase [Acetobacter sp.]|nr:glutamate 5-kinase [Bacteroides sp.]MCM1340292.1 glutamate 5-kinase [Acetobacter sp.]MCM1432758.1 glutamate 5-kinase [Clostridiales bacterium]
MAKVEGKKRIVVKVGTSTLTHKTGKTNIARMAKLVSVLSDLKNEGHEIVLVSSGAIAVGAVKLGFARKPSTTPGLQASAAIGQCELMFLYDKLFSEYGITVSQILLTADTLDHPIEKNHLLDTFNQLLDYDSLPIVNENDSVYVEELLNGDNDCLSASVAQLINADLLILLTDTDGLYNDNPSKNPNAELISVVEQIDDSIYKVAGDAGEKGTGGFVTKIKAAGIANDSGIPVIIMNGEKPTSIYKALSGERIGTYFCAKEG